MPAPLTVVIPTRDAAQSLARTAATLVSGLTSGLIAGLVISDGGSTDETRAIARDLGATIITGPPGRGGQIARGVEAAATPWLLILHADTRLSQGWDEAVRRHMAHGPGRAGYFRLAFDSPALAARLVEAGGNLRADRLGLPWGDQGLLIHRALLKRVGGVPDMPLMEDVALARALRGNLVPLAATALTAPDRYERDGWARRVASNMALLLRYRLGAAPEDLARRYAGPPSEN